MPKYSGKIGAIRKRRTWGEGMAPLEGPHLPIRCAHAPHIVWGKGPMWDLGRKGGYHCRWRASVSCSTSSQMCGSWYFPGFCLGKSHWLWWTWPPLWYRWHLGFPIHNGETVQLDEMTHGVGLIMDRKGLLNVPFTCPQKWFLFCQCIPLCILDGHIFTCILPLLCW